MARYNTYLQTKAIQRSTDANTRQLFHPLLNKHQRAKSFPDLGNLQQPPQIPLNRRGALEHLPIHQKVPSPDQRAPNHDIRQRNLVPHQELPGFPLPIRRQRQMQPPQRRPQIPNTPIIPMLMERRHLEHQHAQDRHRIAHDLLLCEDGPFVDPSARPDIAAEKLVGFGAAVCEEAADGQALGDGEAVVGLEGGALAEGELGEEFGGAVRLALLVVGELDDGEAAEGGDCFGLGA